MTKKQILLTFLLLLSVIKSTAQNGEIVIGKTDSLYSKILGENRALLIHVPKNELKSEKFPVVYLLDARNNFEHTVATIKHLSNGGNQYWPKMMVVGIKNTNRTRDLTPYPVDTTASVWWLQDTGGGDQFMKFMVDELMPYINDNYPTTSYKTLIGHSYGGLMAVYAMENYTEYFNNFIALDPSLWWDNGKFNEASKEILRSKKFVNKSLFVAASDPDIEDLDLEGLAKDTSIISQHVRSIIDYSNTALSNSQNGLQFDWKFYENENHISIPLISTYDAMRSTFSWYRFENPYQFFEDSLSTERLVEVVESHFEHLTKKFEYEIAPPENWINSYGYEMIWSENYDKAYAFFKMNIKNYPNSPKVYNSMAEFYLTQDQKDKAIEYFQKELALKPSESLETRIKDLKNK
ncbi:alpha/beta fold hydrolase [Marivirga salinae]|uniref:Alpha/beta fold hydrolase n=1 Tax=Marivirga salinarum TaxID=3059078 RepID=A0AA51NB46_9BACT|nr:alpha/beta hydrolase-fold protein [Marivirga sp. BDSF4-3]WMN11769.1 alpha/beta fold hydrolase [Marivirga sp. BDSF4-3]